MQIYRSLQEVSYNKNSVLSIGMFDGVHRAHQEILKQIVEKAKAIRGRSVVITFDPHPKEIVSGGKKNVELLSTLNEKLYIFEKYGVDVVFIIPFTFEFSRLSFQEFYSKYVINGVGVAAVVEGFNHQFGRDREAGMNQIVEMGRVHNFSVEALSMMKEGDAVISSSTIRNLLNEGNIPLANAILGYEYSFTGTVVRGHGRGKKLGYPTANINLETPKKLVPKIGVYAVHILVRKEWYQGMMSIGFNPTFDDVHERTTEVNIFDFDMDIYDDVVTVKCIERTRNEMKFTSVDELVAEMGKDKIRTQQILKNYNLINQ
ncbi:MAG: bifunctional riboflavin kinase/FAD synthetase [Ignavibacteriales bacterium]|nr:bifunctional riboflavin kinase/FAD synthetase [Ignavibacteriales bacterium]